MVDAFEFLQSDWLRWEDIDKDAPVDVTISDVKAGKYKDDDKNEHLDVYFREYRKPLGLNNKNLNQIVKLLGRDTDDWIGEPITLVVRDIEVAGETRRGIRIDERQPKPRRRRNDDDDRDPPPRTRKRRDDDDGPKRPSNSAGRRPRKDDGPTEAKRARRDER